MMGLQFENLVLNNRDLILKKLNIARSDIVIDNPFFQRKTKRMKGCQIDYLIQTRFNMLYACDIKFSRKALSMAVVREMKTRLDNMWVPRGMSCVPVLIHFSDVDDAVVDSQYFVEMINFTDFLQGEQ